MTELERRALLGDKQAQAKCTDKGIVLPCPCCGGNGKIVKRKFKTGFYPSGGTYYVHCAVCLVTTQPRKQKTKALDAWNTRSAPPVGRCINCANVCEVGDNLVTCDIFERDMMPDDFCSQFEAREMHNRERLHQD